VQAVLDEVDRGYDLVVVGRSEAWGMDRRLSFKPEEVISRSSASMLVVSAPIASGA
jgi:nucleotide-binding universal stress UspA family protein